MAWVLFKDIPEGTHFQDHNGRRFIKLFTKTAAGLPQQHIRRVLEFTTSDGVTHPQWQDTYNAMDYSGISGKCPDWVEFKIIQAREDKRETTLRS